MLRSEHEQLSSYDRELRTRTARLLRDKRMIQSAERAERSLPQKLLICGLIFVGEGTVAVEKLRLRLPHIEPIVSLWTKDPKLKLCDGGELLAELLAADGIFCGERRELLILGVPHLRPSVA
jgi:hypothetical protein